MISADIWIEGDDILIKHGWTNGIACSFQLGHNSNEEHSYSMIKNKTETFARLILFLLDNDRRYSGCVGTQENESCHCS